MTIELIFLAVIFLLQGILAVRTFRQINAFSESLPPASDLTINRLPVRTDVVEFVQPRQLLRELSRFRYVFEPTTEQAEQIERLTSAGYTPEQARAVATDGTPPPALTTVTVLEQQNAPNTGIMPRISDAVNTYLLRNRGAVADFNLLRDVVQRNIDALEDSITLLLPLPLYLGLLGTMFGIVMGLFNMPTFAIQNFMDGQGVNNLAGVNSLIDGVKYAMIASFLGLAGTTANSWLFRGAKVTVDARKHDLLTFLQTELLPILSESINSGIYDLNRSLDRFGTQFADTAGQLDTIIGRNYDALMAQRDLLERLDKMDLNKIATFNLDVMSKLMNSTASLERFGDFLTNLTALTDNARQLVERTQDVQGVAGQLEQLLTESRRLQQFLTTHFEQLERHSQYFNANVGKVDDTLAEAIGSLRQHTYDRIESVKNITFKENDLLLEAFERNRDVLKNLRYLEGLEQKVSELARQGDKSQQETQQELRALGQTLQQMNQTLARLTDRQEQGLFGRMMRKRL